MPESLIVFDSRNSRVRIALFVLILASLVFVFFAARWQLGDMLAELTSPTDPQVSNIADVAEELAPHDPRAKWLVATAETNVFSTEAIDSSVQLFGETVRLSPYDFHWWIEYGRSLERAGHPAEAEAALKQAIRIAPNYAHPHWQLGNFYLRLGRTDDAFRELNLATRNNPTYRNQVFALIWDYFGHDPSKVEEIAADTPEARADLCLFFAWRSQPVESLRVWNSLSEKQKVEFHATAKTTTQVLWQNQAFREGLEFSRQSGIDPDARIEAITDPGFESPLRNSEETFFGWKIDRADGKADVAPDTSVRHSGTRSLRITFRNYDKQTLKCMWQNVAISPKTKYKLNFWIRTENLRSGGPPFVEVVNATDDKALGASQSFPFGTNEWLQMSVEFTTPNDSKGIYIRTSRGYCGDICPIVGIVWLDDFELAGT
jgi:hypothetical protein